MPPAAIGSFQCIAITGADAHDFLQAQLSADIRKLSPGHWQWNAWLTAQGRVRALMHLADTGGGNLLAVLRGGDAVAVCADLSWYVLRAHVVLEARTLQGYAADPRPGFVAARDHDDFILGFGERGLRLRVPPATSDPQACARWRRADIHAGWPNLPVGEVGFLPAALGLQRLGAVALDKGCYPGQEIVARVEYRGRHKRRLCHVQGTAPLACGNASQPDAPEGVYVLDSVTDVNGTDALIVSPVTSSININVLGNTYKVVSTFIS